MKKFEYLLLPLAALFFTSCENSKQSETNKYPETKKGDIVDTYFGTSVPDPYRWLEDDMSQETKEWVIAQNKVTFSYLDTLSLKKQLRERLSAVWNYEKVSAPFRKGAYTYYYKNNGLQNQSVVYRKDSLDKEEVFLDPNTFSEEGTTSLGQLSFTEDGKLVAYAISEGGSDWRKIIVMDALNKTIIEDTLIDVKFSGISWKNNEGFFYSSYDKPDGSELSAKTDQHKLYYHQLGTNQKEDKVVFGASEDQKRRYVGGSVTKDGKHLIITGANSTSGNEIYTLDLTNPGAQIKKIVDGFDQDAYLVTSDDEYFYFMTNLKAPNKKLVRTKIENPSAENWIDIIPETENVLNISKGGGYFFAQYMVDAISMVKQFNYQGELIREVNLPGIGTASGFGGKNEDTLVYYTFTNYITPPTIYSFHNTTGKSESYFKPNIDFNPEDFESKQIFYTSKDGTKIPMIISHKKGLDLNKKNPTMLYGYGGFNISLTPSFSVANLVWMEMGGIYAVPNLRGGGEYGKEWHLAGTKMNKQNVFDDFIAAADYLVENQYTSKDYLAISGRSNGGLLVGATMTQAPEKFAVALPGVGVLDMLRYHQFTAGAGWAYDYGTADDSEEMFKYLKNYSPLHNIKQGVEYPATLVTTGDHDDRVVPAHSFKFAATLQEAHKGDNPVMIRIETDAGHGAGTPINKIIEQRADIFAFTLANMGSSD
jgi:prolyl oligopeptidase